MIKTLLRIVTGRYLSTSWTGMPWMVVTSPTKYLYWNIYQSEICLNSWLLVTYIYECISMIIFGTSSIKIKMMYPFFFYEMKSVLSEINKHFLFVNKKISEEHYGYDYCFLCAVTNEWKKNAWNLKQRLDRTGLYCH